MNSDGKMYFGLDMGTASVGWAVTDENYYLLRAKGKDLWGARLFDEAQTKADRRIHRTARRRGQRKHARIGLLKEYFSEEISKVDPGFFQRLKESKYHLEDRSENNFQRNALFNDPSFSDKEYFKQYPTVFHLRADLLKPWNEKKDIRFLYLAIENIFKHRGNFLNSSLETDGAPTEGMTFAWQTFCEKAEEFDINFSFDADTGMIERVLSQRGLSRNRVLEQLAETLDIKKSEKMAYELVRMLVGNKGKLQVIFGENIVDTEHKTLTLGFRDSSYEETADEVRALIGDNNFELIEAAKDIHDIGLLANLLKGEKYISDARVSAYNEHKADLKLLKDVLKRYDQQAYNLMFRVMQEGNYSAYVGSVNHKSREKDCVVRRNGGNGRSRDDLYKTIKGILKAFPQDDQDVITILDKVSNEAFLNKQLTSDNGVIPNQVYVRELRKILENAEAYYKFLKEKDESGLTVSQRIIELLQFRLPYYVGPLGTVGENVWVRRKEDGRILPWNLEEKIDVRRTREEFIKRMVQHCTYLREEETLPKNSILYQKYMVLNELNNLKVNNEPISPEIKQGIYKEIFEVGKKVHIKQIENYFKQHGLVGKDECDFLSGIDVEGGFKASLDSEGKFKAVLGKKTLDDRDVEIAEQIIFWKTIYSDDKKMIRDCISESYPGVFTDSQIKRILGFKMDGWGNLSREFLQMEGVSKTDGVMRPLITALWETNDNLMMLLSDRYTYVETLNDRIQQEEKELSEWEFDDLEGMYLSAPVKRMIWQTMKIVRELVEVTGRTPERIFVEMPREDGEKGTRTDSRKRKLMDLYKGIKEDDKNWIKEIDGRDEPEYRNKKLYLYYLQMGRCMYSGEVIDLHTLLTSNDIYDIDHIYPQHYVKDDSIENNLVLVKKEINNRKSGNYPIEGVIRRNMHSFWKMLAEKHFISQEKYNRLTRAESFTEYERADFISRQLVETRQGTKAITQILQQVLPQTEIVFSKSNAVSDFRKHFNLLKVRCVNDFHHAQDAYLNIVVGNAYRTKFTRNPISFIREADKNGNKGVYQYHMAKIFDYDIIRGAEIAWRMPKDGKPGTISIVKNVMERNTPIITRRSYNYAKGRNITNKDTIYSKRVAKEGSYMGVSTTDSRLADVTKYGGRSDISSMCYTLVSYIVRGKEIRSLEALPVYLGDITNLSDEEILGYLQKLLQDENGTKPVTNLKILIKDIRYNQLLKIDGFFYYLGGRSGNRILLETGISLIIDKETMYYIKKLEKAVNTDYYGEKDVHGVIISEEKNAQLYRYLLEKLENSILRNRKNNITSTLKDGYDKFINCSLEEQSNILMGIIEWMSGTKSKVDIKSIGGSANSGVCMINKKISEANEIKLINLSATGMLRREINLKRL